MSRHYRNRKPGVLDQRKPGRESYSIRHEPKWFLLFVNGQPLAEYTGSENGEITRLLRQSVFGTRGSTVEFDRY